MHKCTMTYIPIQHTTLHCDARQYNTSIRTQVQRHAGMHTYIHAYERERERDIYIYKHSTEHVHLTRIPHSALPPAAARSAARARSLWEELAMQGCFSARFRGQQVMQTRMTFEEYLWALIYIVLATVPVVHRVKPIVRRSSAQAKRTIPEPQLPPPACQKTLGSV